MGVLNYVIAILIGLVIWRLSMYIIRMLSTPPPEVDPDDVIDVHQDYKCSICGTEVTMTIRNVSEADAPKHCREEMVPVWRP